MNDTTLGMRTKIEVGLFWKILSAIISLVVAYFAVQTSILDKVKDGYVNKSNFEMLNVKMDVMAMMLLENGDYDRFLDLTNKRIKN